MFECSNVGTAHGNREVAAKMSSTMRSSSESAFSGAGTSGVEDAAGNNTSASGQQRRPGGFGRKLPLSRIDANTPNKNKNKNNNNKASSSSASAKKEMDTVVSSISKSRRSRATRLFTSNGKKNVSRRSSSSGSSSRDLTKRNTNEHNRVYDFDSITASGRSVSDEVTMETCDDFDAKDDADKNSLEWNRLPAATAANAVASRTISIFRGRGKSSGPNGAVAADDSSPAIPSIQRANAISSVNDLDRHYTIHFDSYHEEAADETIEDTATSTLCGSNRLEAEVSGMYVIPSAATPEPRDQKVSIPSTFAGLDSVFRVVDDTVESIVDSMLCLQRANPILDDVVGDDDNDLKLSESGSTNRMYFQPESLWDKKDSNPMVICCGSLLSVDDETRGYVIPFPS